MLKKLLICAISALLLFTAATLAELPSAGAGPALLDIARAGCFNGEDAHG